MLKNYFKQAWTLMRQNRLFTGIYVVGTGLSIALVMTLFIIFYVKFGPVYPEYNRDRTLVLKPLKRYPKDKPENWTINGGVAYYVVDQMLPGLSHVEQVAGSMIDFWGNYQVSAADVKPFKVTPRFANGAFWKVFSFRFVDGQPFTQEDVEAKAQVAVIGESLAKRLFAAVEGVEGRHFTFNGRDYRVCGVVRDVSNATPETAGDLWLPLLNAQYMSKELDRFGLLGNVYVSLLVDDAENLETVRSEVQDAFRRYTLQDKDYEYDVMGQPDPYWLSTFRQDVEKAPDTMELVKDFLYILLALLFIPALNLSGMISSRMDSRIAELGIRKGLRSYTPSAAGAGALREPVAHTAGRSGRPVVFLSDCVDGQRLDSDAVRQEHLQHFALHVAHTRDAVQSRCVRQRTGRVRGAQCGVGPCACAWGDAASDHGIVEYEEIGGLTSNPSPKERGIKNDRNI